MTRRDGHILNRDAVVKQPHHLRLHQLSNKLEHKSNQQEQKTATESVQPNIELQFLPPWGFSKEPLEHVSAWMFLDAFWGDIASGSWWRANDEKKAADSVQCKAK